MPYFKENKTEIYYEVHGKGKPLILIAGLASDSQSWQFILEEISKHFKVIVYDNRGTGRTKVPNLNFTINDFAQDALKLLDFLGIKNAFILGHSMGGCVAQEIAIIAKEKIRKMILVSCTTCMSERNKSLFDFLISSWKNGLSHDMWFRNLFYWLFSPDAFNNDKFLNAAIIYALCYPYPQTAESFKAQVDALVKYDSTNKIKNIRTETLLISGKRDILVYPEECELLKKIPGFNKMILMEKAAHSIHAEYPEEFLKIVLDYLK